MSKRKPFLSRVSKNTGTFVFRVLLEETKTLGSGWGYDEIHVAGNAFAFIVTLVSRKGDQCKPYRNHTVLTGDLRNSVAVAEQYVKTLREGVYCSHGFNVSTSYATVIV